MKKIFIVFTVLSLLISQTPRIASAAETVGLDVYLEMVRAGNHSLKSGLRSVEATYYGVLASVAYQRPFLAAGGSASYMTDQGEEMVYGTNVALSFNIDISGSYTLDERQQILSYESQRAAFDSNINALMASAENTYWSAVLARENIALQEDILRQRQENSRVTEEKFNQQLVPRLDVIRAEAQVATAESLMTQAQGEYLNLLATMKELTGGIEVIPLEDPLRVPVFDVTANLEKALLSRPDARAASLALERNKIVKKLRAKGMSPTLTAAVRWSPWSDPWNSSSPQKGELGASLTLNIPIIDGNETKYNILNADMLTQAAEESLLTVENKIDTELEVALNNWELAEALEQDKKRQAERSQEELRITELMYREGMGAQIELINAQTENQQVRTDYLNAVKGMYSALVELRRTVGDYAPAEDGSWKEAAVRHGRGTQSADIIQN